MRRLLPALLIALALPALAPAAAQAGWFAADPVDGPSADIVSVDDLDVVPRRHRRAGVAPAGRRRAARLPLPPVGRRPGWRPSGSTARSPRARTRSPWASPTAGASPCSGSAGRACSAPSRRPGPGRSRCRRPCCCTRRSTARRPAGSTRRWASTGRPSRCGAAPAPAAPTCWPPGSAAGRSRCSRRRWTSPRATPRAGHGPPAGRGRRGGHRRRRLGRGREVCGPGGCSGSPSRATRRRSRCPSWAAGRTWRRSTSRRTARSPGSRSASTTRAARARSRGGSSASRSIPAR